jgi:formylglycine-generating enzyme required for sulfatase activity
MTNCGAGGEGTESCCTSLEVTGGTFYRTYDPLVEVDGAPSGTSPDRVLVGSNGEPVGEADPATVSSFLLDKYEVTVGRFRQFVSAWKGGWTPSAGSGKHVHLNGGKGLVPGGDTPALIRIEGGTIARIDHEPGWDTSDDVNIAPTDANLFPAPPSGSTPRRAETSNASTRGDRRIPGSTTFMPSMVASTHPGCQAPRTPRCSFALLPVRQTRLRLE